MGRLDGKVAFITGVARGQGRSHALQLAAEGADVIGVDICKQIESVPYPLATPADLATTVESVTKLGRRIAAAEVDVRDSPALQSALEKGIAEMGRLDIVVANAGIAPLSVHPHDREWDDVIGVNLTGVYNSLRLSIPHMIEGNRGGSIVIVSSTAGLTAFGGRTPGDIGYAAAKHGLVGLMRTYADFLAPHNIRVNSVHPTGVRTPMVINPAVEAFLVNWRPAGREGLNALPVDMIEPSDISNAISWLVSDEARYVTGVALPVDAGYVNKR